MSRAVFGRAAALLGAAALAAGAAWVWAHRPWRVVASVNGATLTASELDLRVQTFGGGGERDREWLAKTWIVKELLLGEAVHRGVRPEPGDEQEASDLITAWLAAHGSAPERFFADGPLPEASKRQDFKEGVLVNLLVRDELVKQGFRELVGELFGRADVRCGEYPGLEKLHEGGAPLPLYAGMWGWEPMRVVAGADGSILTSAELDLRARNMLDDVRRMGRNVPKEREREALAGFRRDAVKQWFLKQVLCDEAVRQGFTVTPPDEKEEMAKVVASLKRHKLTVEQFFKDGPLPESVKRADFRAAILAGKLARREVSDKINVTGREIEAEMSELRRKGEKADRKAVIGKLRGDRFKRGYRELFRSLFVKARVFCTEFPDLEKVDGVSPPVPEERGGR